MDKKGSKFRTDQPGVVPVDILGDASLRRIQAKMNMRYPVSIDEIKKSAKVEKSVKKEAGTLKFASIASIPKDFEPLGTGFYRKGHSLWSLQKEGDSFILVRAQEEQFEDEEEVEETFEEILEKEDEDKDEEKESQVGQPPSTIFNSPSPMNGTASRQAQEQYSPEIVSGVMDALAMHSIHLTDEGARDYIHQYRNANPDSPLDPGAVATWINQKRGDPMFASRQAHQRTAVDKAARDYYTSYYGGDVAKDYGKALTENKHTLISPLVAKAYFKMMGRTMPPPLKKARPDWNKLASKHGPEMINDVRTWLGEGLVQVHIASHLGCRPEIAHVWRPVITKIGMLKARALRNNLIRRVAVSKLTASHTTKTVRVAQRALDIETQHLTKKIAVDQVAKDYYKKYYGNYGSELTKDINELLVTAPKAD